MTIRFSKLLLLIILLVLPAIPIFAATVIPVYFSTDNVKVNVVSGRLLWSGTGPVGFGDGGSIISFWLERPSAANQYRFSGIIPGGLAVNHSLLFTVNVAGSGRLQIADWQAFANDGRGTLLPAGTAWVTVGAPEAAAVADKLPPENFTPVVARDSNLFDNQYFVSFAAEDKQSGIDHYEISESNQSAWQHAESPYLLRDQSRRSDIFVKAIDLAGNERIAVVPTLALHWYQHYLILGIILLLLLIIIWFVFIK